MGDESMRLNLEERMGVWWSLVRRPSLLCEQSCFKCRHTGSPKAKAINQGLGAGALREIEGAEFCALNRILRCYPSPLGHKIAIYKAHSDIG